MKQFIKPVNETVPVVFAKSRLPAGYIIRAFTWSRWSHCGLVAGNYVYEARFLHGVVKTPIDEFKARYSDWEIAQVPCHDIDQAYTFVKNQLGKSYDLIGAIGIGIRTSWNHSDKFSCSELLAAAGIGRFRKERIKRISPEHLWMVSEG